MPQEEAFITGTERRAAPLPELFRAQILHREFPVDELVDQGIHVIEPSILVVEIVCMLPYVDGQQRSRRLLERRMGIARLDDLEFLAVLNQPCPARCRIALPPRSPIPSCMRRRCRKTIRSGP